ncbi:hypothetical protein [Otariodibacter oris]|uniref:Uncharacterized protein n=1 Tax=Otariodibacter oris TaxID=1032623 RepID=A0A420XFE5_9PAST|nr:hypothetical protein [Otariodibacter oris]QGM81486.1 hypothetical protein A6A10_08745 [Otariodibacter oris]RKR71092.1 hypothetical protein DES31_1670 [Otariodibacter oris]
MDLKSINIDENLAKKILVKKSDLSKLGINIEVNKKENKRLSIEFKPFVTMEYFNLNQATYLVLGCPPLLDINGEDDLFFNTRASIVTAVKENKLPDSIIEGSGFNYVDRISHVSLERWAKFYGYNWVLPPYIPYYVDDTESISNDNKSLIEDNERLKKENSLLNKKIEDMEKQAQLVNEKNNNQIINYEQGSLYGYFTENLELVFKMCKQMAECDPDNPFSYPTKKQFTDHLIKRFSCSRKSAEAIYIIVAPKEAKFKGRPPKNVDTFQGFK